MQELTLWLRRRRADLLARRFRGVLWIAAPVEVARARARLLIAAGDWRSPLWVGTSVGARGKAANPPPEAPPEAIPVIAPGRSRGRLGQEHDLIVFDTLESGFDPDAFGAISGTVVAGGWLLLLIPEHWHRPDDLACDDEWHGDADYARLAHWPFEAGDIPARYLARLACQLGAFEMLSTWPEGAALPTTPAMPATPTASSVEAAPPIADSTDADCLTSDQAAAVARLTRLRRRRPVVLVADRGRGKSAALGIAAARRLSNGENRLWMTSASEAAIEPVFERLQALLPQGRRTPGRFAVTLGERECVLEWLAPERVIAALEDPAVDRRSPPTLFVDEAASIPAARLTAWLGCFPRLAFATTVHGYEGTGRGFEVRLRETLDRLTPDWRRLRLETPIRWASGDPLERLTGELLCLDADVDEIDEGLADRLTPTDGPGVALQWLERTALAHQEPTLRSVFGLLVQAHYRTTPGDLRQLLDGPGVRILAARLEGRIAGLCVVQEEGGFDPALAGAIQRGERRPRGHLLAQSLAMHAGHAAAAQRRWWRVMRIAVHPALRRRGIGATLIEAVAHRALADGIERLGTSFGSEPGLVRFWRGAGFSSLRVGLTREAASGEPALMMARGLTPSADTEIAEWAADFQTLLADLLVGELRDIEPQVAAGWLHEGAPPSWPETLTPRLEAFAAGGGELASIRPWLRRAWLCWWRQQPLDVLPVDLAASPTSGRAPADIAPAAAVAALFQHRDAALGAGDGTAGRRARQAAARALTRALLAWHRIQTAG